MLWKIILLLIGAYLLGSIPTAYLIGRWLRGIDIRQYGTGNVGANNVWHSVAHWALIPVGAFDLGKAALPTWLALGPLDLGYPLAIAAGLCAVMGHAWSLYLGFTGGRAVSSILGILVIIFPWGVLVELSLMIIGLGLHIEQLTTLGLLALPFLSLALGQPRTVTWGCVAMLTLTMLKRVEANRTPLPAGPERWQVIWRRLWLDRDIPSHKEWVSRRPPSPRDSTSGEHKS